ncbi:MAG: gluconate kinase [Anaerolineaceae bacterium]|nr:gluconate kinase [Anaerolineaceae bacterium]
MSKLESGRVYVVMGVSGCGKSTVGQALAQRLDCSFYDGDDFHPAANVAKMSQGIPLNDEDRWPWLDRLADLMAEHLGQGETAVLACSALKEKYRQRLKRGQENVIFVYLRGSFDLIWQRMQHREGHYMKAEMLQSQFDALEEPDPTTAIVVDIDQDIASMISEIIGR